MSTGSKISKPWTLTAVAAQYGLTIKALRKYCEQGIIPEARQTPGKQWRLALPISVKTQQLLFRKAKSSGAKSREIGKPTGDFSDNEEQAWEAIDEVERQLAEKHKEIVLPLNPFADTNFDEESREFARKVYAAAYDRQKARNTIMFRAATNIVLRKENLTAQAIATELGIARTTLSATYGGSAVQQAIDYLKKKTPDEIRRLAEHVGEEYRNKNKAYEQEQKRLEKGKSKSGRNFPEFRPGFWKQQQDEFYKELDARLQKR
jgi:DNA-binding transcriptional MerR regulator